MDAVRVLFLCILVPVFDFSIAIPAKMWYNTLVYYTHPETAQDAREEIAYVVF